jgi:aryl-alcohol dehydrogenase-like predicted oxidoreductase
MKLGLGTVQFGQAYGVSNRRGQVTRTDAESILARARQAGITLLDTAANYGEAEQVLATLYTAGFRIVTKTINLAHGIDAVATRARRSQALLDADTLLVHAAADLADARLWPALQELKNEGVFRRIGISAYVKDDPVKLAEKFHPDVMQLPFSLLDQRLSNALPRLKSLGVEVHARSLFLQGLLLMDEPPEKLRGIAADLTQVKARIAASGSTPLAAAIAFARSRPELDFGLVGVTSPDELDEVLAAMAASPPNLDWPALALKDERALTPSLW